MRSSLWMLAGVLGLSGCASLDNPVSFTDLQAPSQQFVTDESPADDYPGFLTGEGSDFSCRYGIHFESKDEFSPPKAQLFAALLAQALPQITTHKVVLRRFDVYFNYRLKILHDLGNAGVGGVVGSSMAEQAAMQNMGVFTFDKLLIDTNPEVDRHPGQNQVGCDNAHEGEYYPSEISGGFSVVVSWFKFTVDGHPYEFRTFYQFQPDTKAQKSAGIAEAIRMSIQGIAKKIQF
ncbi:MAG TPA: hypothetical protein VGO35_02120 [Gammaproteobacteria bacterium]|nr:hypothetical protein [Gammaproteobacteria bacterium]